MTTRRLLKDPTPQRMLINESAVHRRRLEAALQGRDEDMVTLALTSGLSIRCIARKNRVEPSALTEMVRETIAELRSPWCRGPLRAHQVRDVIHYVNRQIYEAGHDHHEYVARVLIHDLCPGSYYDEQCDQCLNKLPVGARRDRRTCSPACRRARNRPLPPGRLDSEDDDNDARYTLDPIEAGRVRDAIPKQIEHLVLPILCQSASIAEVSRAYDTHPEYIGNLLFDAVLALNDCVTYNTASPIGFRSQDTRYAFHLARDVVHTEAFGVDYAVPARHVSYREIPRLRRTAGPRPCQFCIRNPAQDVSAYCSVECGQCAAIESCRFFDNPTNRLILSAPCRRCGWAVTWPREGHCSPLCVWAEERGVPRPSTRPEPFPYTPDPWTIQVGDPSNLEPVRPVRLRGGPQHLAIAWVGVKAKRVQIPINNEIAVYGATERTATHEGQKIRMFLFEQLSHTSARELEDEPP